MNLKQKSIYFCGIGGIGMSALARISSKLFNAKVFGSDVKEGKNVINLRKEGFDVKIGQTEENLKDIDLDLFVYTSALKNNNPEFTYAKENKIETISRGDFLAKIAKNFKNKIVISGTHGKTTTTAIMSFIFDYFNLNPTVILGGVMKSGDLKSNFKLGDDEILIIESDESDGSFNSLEFDYSVITSIEEDHMDFYKTSENLVKSFYTFANKTKKKIIICNEYNYCKKIIEDFKDIVLTYGFSNSNLMAENIKKTKDGFIFDIIFKDKKIIEDFYLSMFGEYNILNLLASVAILIENDINFYEDKKFLNCFKNFKGIENRFQIEGHIDKHLIINDYAHNPTKIKSAIESVIHFKENNTKYANHQIVLIFEAHRYTRVKDLMDKFSEAFKKVDKIFVLDIFASSETPIDGIDEYYIVNFLKKDYPLKEIIYLKTDVVTIYDKIKEVEDSSIFLYTSAGNTTLTDGIIKLHNKE